MPLPGDGGEQPHIFLFSTHIQAVAESADTVAQIGGAFEFKVAGGGAHILFKYGNELGLSLIHI